MCKKNLIILFSLILLAVNVIKIEAAQNEGNAFQIETAPVFESAASSAAGNSLAIEAALAPPTNSTPQVKTIDKIAVKVNNEIIMQSEINEKIAILKQQMLHSGQTIPDDKTITNQVVNAMIDMCLQLQIAKRSGLTTTAAEIDAAIKNIAQRNHVTRAELKAELERTGMDYAAFRAQISDQILIAKITEQMVRKKISIGETDIAAYRKNHFKSTRTEAQNAIFQEKMRAELKLWLNELRKTAYIKIGN